MKDKVHIQSFNEHPENISGVSFSDLKNYCKYLIDEYEKIKSGEGGRVMSDLRQFYEEGKIKDLIFKNTSNKSKINFLNIYKDKILFFAQSRNIALELMNFEDFLIIQKIAGHSSSKTTEIYTHVSNQLLSKVNLPI